METMVILEQVYMFISLWHAYSFKMHKYHTIILSLDMYIANILPNLECYSVQPMYIHKLVFGTGFAKGVLYMHQILTLNSMYDKAIKFIFDYRVTNVAKFNP